jgi:hypothetical protein
MPFLRHLAVALVLASTASCGADPAGEKSAVPLATAVPDEPTGKEADDSGMLEINSIPPVKVLVDGKDAGTTPIHGFKVAPGSHDVTFVDEVGGNRTMTVSVDAGQGQTVTSNRPVSARDAREHTDKPDKKDKKQPSDQ